MIANDLFSSMQGRLQESTKPARYPSTVPRRTLMGFAAELQGAFNAAQTTFTEQSWGDRFPSNVAIFPKSNRIIANQYGVLIPQVVLGNDVVVACDKETLPSGGVRVVVSAQPRDAQVKSARRVEVIGSEKEQTWLEEHRHEYVGEWVAHDGDRLLAHGPDARGVYDEARSLGVPVPAVVRIEASDASAKNGVINQSPYRASRQRAKARESLEREFKALAQRWRNETTHLSIASEKANNLAYQQIIGMGEQVLPLIFRELETTTSDWFWALRAIARDRAPVIPAEDRGRVRRIAEIWMEWGKQNGYVSG